MAMDLEGNSGPTEQSVSSEKVLSYCKAKSRNTVTYREQLWDAINTRDIDKVRLLLEQGADPNHLVYFSDEWRKDGPPLHRACYAGFLEIVKELVDHGADVEKRCVWSNLSPLHYACQGGDKDVVMYLIDEAKCAVDVRDNSGWTPLHYACEYGGGEKDVVQYLVEVAKCDVGAKDNEDQTPLESALDSLYENEGNGLDVILYLIKHGCANDQQKAEVLRAACYYAKLDLVKELVEELNISPNDVTDDDEKSPLYLNLYYLYDAEDHLDVALYLIKRGCGDDQDKAKLICGACYWGKLDVVKELVEQHKVNPNNVRDAENKDNQTPLHCACERGHKDVVQYLVEVHECDIGAIDDKDRTPLDVASNADVVDYLKARNN